MRPYHKPSIHYYFIESTECASVEMVKEVFLQSKNGDNNYNDNGSEDEKTFTDIIKHLEALNKIMVVGEDIHII